MIVDGTGTGDYSVFSVTGTVGFGGTLNLVPGGSFASEAAGSDVPFLTFSGGRNGTFASVTVTPPISGYTSTLDYSGTTSVGAKTQPSSPPAPSTPGPAISGAAVAGQTLATTNGTWTNSPTTFVYEWEDCDSSDTSCTPVGATNSSYTLQNSDVGHTVRSVVTATGAAASETSSATAVVIAPAPLNTAPLVTTGTALPGDKLTCGKGTWMNSPSSCVYRWRRNGVAISGATASTYTVKLADENAAITCSVVATNSGGPSAAAISSSRTVAKPGTLTCKPATGSLSGAKLGPFTLGMSKVTAEAALSPHKTIAGHEQFCLYGGWDINVAYPTTALLKSLHPAERLKLKNHVVLAMTSNIAYAAKSVRPGTTLKAAKHALKLSTAVARAGNDWYFVLGAKATTVIKVRGGVVQEIGVADEALVQTSAARTRFVKAFTAA